MVDWNTVRSTHWSITWDKETATSHLRYAGELTTWCGAEGEKRLTADSLSYEEWDELYRKAFDLCGTFETAPSVTRFIYEAMKCGIHHFSERVKRESPTEMQMHHRDSQLDQWWRYIIGQLDANFSPLDQNTQVAERNRALIDSLIPVAQQVKSNHDLERLAGLRYPRDEQARQLFMTRHKNWA